MTLVKLAVVISHPTQHFVPLYQTLAAAQGIELKVFYLAGNGVQVAHDAEFGVNIKWDTPMLEGYDYEFVEPGRVLNNFGFFSVDSPYLREKLAGFQADWLWVHGYAQRANWRAIMGKRKATKVLYTSDSNAWIDRHQRQPFIKRTIKSLVVRYYFRYVDVFLSISPANRAYLKKYGAQNEQIVDTTFPVDISRLDEQRTALGEAQLRNLRVELNIPSTATLLLVVCKLIPRKRVVDVLKATAQLADKNTHLLVIGSGECRAELERQASELSLNDRVHLPGFVNQGKLAAYFSIADVMVFPSENEPYGAVVAEGLPFALPIVIASEIGAVGASAMIGKNALEYKVGDISDLVKQLDTILANPNMKSSFSQHSKAIAHQHDKSMMANEIVKVCHGI